EGFSAFGTVGLSLGVTPHLSAIGKLIVLVLMFEGKIGLISLAMTNLEPPPHKKNIDYPSEEVLIG
ncbi:MAG TPA: Trk family potassium uptake protein, partial [Spirochaetia bacterium]|nr:Trk family potassium uptake protein [Spirochaetia bacterium]